MDFSIKLLTEGVSEESSVVSEMDKNPLNSELLHQVGHDLSSNDQLRNH